MRDFQTGSAIRLKLFATLAVALLAWARPAAAQGPLTALHPGFDLVNFRPADLMPDVSGMDFLSDGRLVVCTWGGDRNKLLTPSKLGKLYIISGATGSNPKATYVTVATGLEEPLGLKVVDDEIYICEREGLWRFAKSGNTYVRANKIASAPGGVHRSEWFYGLAYKDGYFYANFALEFNDGGVITVPQDDPHRGTVAKISKADGTIEYLAGGFRTHNGITLNPDGDIFVTDNQGQWMPSGKFTYVKKGAFYGVYPGGEFEKPADQAESPTAYLPYKEADQSPGEPIYIPFGPYKGQFFVSDVCWGGLERVFVEKVNGEYNGCVFQHSEGFEAGTNRLVWGPDSALYVGGIGTGADWVWKTGAFYGLQKVKFNGKQPFEMLSMKSRAGGMEIEFSQDVGASAALASNYEAKIWDFKPSITYGAGNKQDVTLITVKSVTVNADKRRVFLAMDGLKTKWLVYVHPKGVLSATGEKPWTMEAWYTLNNASTDPPFTVTSAVRQYKLSELGAKAWSVAPYKPGVLRLKVDAAIGAYQAEAFDSKGSKVASAIGRGGAETLLPVQGSTHGTFLIRLIADGSEQTRIAVLP